MINFRHEVFKLQKQPPDVFYKKAVLKNFVKFTGKHLCQSLFFNTVAGTNESAIGLDHFDGAKRAEKFSLM